MQILFFIFFKTLDGLEINTTLRVSTWVEDDEMYLMPCRFIAVINEGNAYNLKVEVLDPSGFIQDNYLEKKFFFGHTGKVIGYGILKGIGSHI